MKAIAKRRAAYWTCQGEGGVGMGVNVTAEALLPRNGMLPGMREVEEG